MPDNCRILSDFRVSQMQTAFFADDSRYVIAPHLREIIFGAVFVYLSQFRDDFAITAGFFPQFTLNCCAKILTVLYAAARQRV